MIRQLVVLGAGGDLTGRYLLPALARLKAAGALPDPFTVIGVGREESDDEAFRRHAAACLQTHAADVPQDARHTLCRALGYQQPIAPTP